MKSGNLTLVGRYRSPFTRRVAVSLRALGFDYELRSKTARQDFEEIKTLNPLGRVPVLVLGDGETMFDSNVILDYLDNCVGSKRALVPPHGPERRKVQKMVAVALGGIDKSRELMLEAILRPEALRHQPWSDRSEGQINASLAALEADAETPWIAGDRMTQADVTTGVMIDFTRLYHPHLVHNGAYPKLDALHAAYAELPAFAETVPEPD